MVAGGQVVHVLHGRDRCGPLGSTRIIGEILDCVCGSDAEIEPCLSPLLMEQLRGVDREIDRLALTRDSLAGLVAATGGRPA